MVVFKQTSDDIEGLLWTYLTHADQAQMFQTNSRFSPQLLRTRLQYVKSEPKRIIESLSDAVVDSPDSLKLFCQIVQEAEKFIETAPTCAKSRDLNKIVDHVVTSFSRIHVNEEYWVMFQDILSCMMHELRPMVRRMRNAIAKQKENESK